LTYCCISCVISLYQ